jgi:CRP-like cAMP-binding protein
LVDPAVRNAIRCTPAFRELPADALNALAERGELRLFDVGAILARQGDPVERVFLIVAGRAEVRRSHPSFRDSVVLAELGPGDVVGKIEALDGGSGVATVTVTEATETVVVSAPELNGMMRRFPEISEVVGRLLSRGLRHANALSGHLLEASDSQSDRAAG